LFAGPPVQLTEFSQLLPVVVVLQVKFAGAA
jgi:hypothetical protein